jgi:hypothetical protein
VQVGDRFVPPRIFVHSRIANVPDLKMKIEVREGIPVVTEVTLQARPDGPEVRRRHLDALALDDLLEQIVAACSVKDADGTGRTLIPDMDRGAALRNVRGARSGRTRISQERLLKAAEIYREHVDGRPTEAIARAFGVSHRTAARYVQHARKSGLLSPTTPGKKKA